MRVVTSLDSLIIGEQQIIGQFKNAVDMSRKHGMMTRTMNVLSNLAIRAGKKAQTETSIGAGGASISWAAVSMAQQLLGSLNDKTILVLGAGKMAHLAADNLRQKGVARIFVVNRTQEKAETLARHIGGMSACYWEMKEILKEADVVFCSAGAAHFIVDKSLVEKVMRERCQQPLLAIDISIPRNIDPSVGSVPGVTLVTIDELGKVIEASIQQRLNAIDQVEGIIKSKVTAFFEKINKNRQPSEFEADSLVQNNAF